MGRTLVKVQVENYDDVLACRGGKLAGEQVRRIVQEALVDTGSALLCLHGTLIQELGSVEDRKVRVRTANGQAYRTVYGPVHITILDRHCWGEVMEVPDDAPALLGYIPLESLDLVVDPRSNAVVPNPANGGKYTLDLF